MWLFVSLLVLGVVAAIVMIASLGPIASHWTDAGESWFTGADSSFDGDDGFW